MGLNGLAPDAALECANPRVLAFLRAVAIVVQVAAVLGAVLFFETPVPLLPLVCGLAMLAVADLATFSKPNVLARRLSWVLAAIAVACYAALLLCNDAATYGVLAILLPWLGIRICDIHLQQGREVQAAADKEARERYVLGLATLAAGTAHEMGTPLSTMSVIVGDLRDSDAPPPAWKESVEVLWQQLQTCRRSLSGLARAADASRVGSTRAILARQLVDSLVERIHLLRPEVSIRVRSMFADPGLRVKADLTLPQALLNLINNAADASPREVELRVAQRDAKLVLEILDRGPGIPPAVRERLGEPFVTGKEPGRGCGIGVFLANTAIERLGGTATMLERKKGGTRVQVELPVFRAKWPRRTHASNRE